jgi:hypothetical protein
MTAAGINICDAPERRYKKAAPQGAAFLLKKGGGTIPKH